jgi:regulator of CtrA degradation
MPKRASSITPVIIETLYDEALSLAEDARDAFEQSGAFGPDLPNADEARIALSCEALRATTRMMHALAWLLNHRAFFAGELSEFQLRRHGRLPDPQPVSNAAQLALLDLLAVQVVQQSIAFYARVQRLEQSWRLPEAEVLQPVQSLRARIGKSFAVN